MYSCRGQNQLPTPQNPPKRCPIWMYDTSIPSSDHVVSDDIKIFAVSLVVFKWRGGAESAPPSSYVSQKPIQFRVKRWKAFLSYSKLLMITLPIPVLSNSRVLLYPSEVVKMVFKRWKAFLSYSKLLMITLPIPVLSNSRVLLDPSEVVKMVFKRWKAFLTYSKLLMITLPIPVLVVVIVFLFWATNIRNKTTQVVITMK